jgi:Ca-activated chloride channel family protein
MSDADNTPIPSDEGIDVEEENPGPSPFTPPPPVERALTMTMTPGNTQALALDTALEPLLFTLRTTGSPAGAAGHISGSRLPINLALVIDCSGSMGGEPLTYAKKACAQVVDLLGPEDKLTIISFAETAEVLMPARRVVHKPQIREVIYGLRARSTTNLYDGMLAAFNQLGAAKTEHSVNRLLLLTDGEPSAGTRDFGSILGQVAEQRARGIGVSAIGLGGDYNDEFISGLARRSGGSFTHVETPEEIPEAFRAEIERLSRIVARQVRLRLTVPSGVSVRQVHGRQPVFGNRTAEVTLDDIELGSSQLSLWEMETSPRPVGTYRLARAELIYEDGATGLIERLSADLTTKFVADLETVNQTSDAGVREIADWWRSIRSLDKTMMELRKQGMPQETLEAAFDVLEAQANRYGRGDAVARITKARTAIFSGGATEKLLMDTVFNLDQVRLS